MSKNNVSYIKYSDTSIALRINGKHKVIQGESPERIEEIFEAAKTAKEKGTDESIEELLGVIEPIRRYELQGVVEVDQDGNVYYGDTDVPMPEELGDLMVKFSEQDKEIDPLLNFWQLCLLNPNETARDNFFDYVKDYGVVITDNGYVILYKALNKSPEDKKSGGGDTLVEFVAKQYLRIKRMSKAPSNYNVYTVHNQDKGETRFELSTHSGNPPPAEENEVLSCLGNLEDYHNQIQDLSVKDQTTFVPWYTGGQYGTEVKLGVPVEMPREKCDPDINVGCSYGLHVGSFDYVSRFGRGMDSILAVLVNPRDIVALPKHDNSKIRTCRYFPYAVMERDEEGNWEEIEEGYFEEDYADIEKKDIERELKLMYKEKKRVEEQGQELAESFKNKEDILTNRLVDL